MNSQRFYLKSLKQWNKAYFFSWAWLMVYLGKDQSDMNIQDYSSLTLHTTKKTLLFYYLTADFRPSIKTSCDAHSHE